jgi:hypothetical protein
VEFVIMRRFEGSGKELEQTQEGSPPGREQTELDVTANEYTEALSRLEDLGS